MGRSLPPQIRILIISGMLILKIQKKSGITVLKNKSVFYTLLLLPPMVMVNRGGDDKMDIDRLSPLYGYGYFKQLFDQWVNHQGTVFPKQRVGLKFFNVYG